MNDVEISKLVLMAVFLIVFVTPLLIGTAIIDYREKKRKNWRRKVDL